MKSSYSKKRPASSEDTFKPIEEWILSDTEFNKRVVQLKTINSQLYVDFRELYKDKDDNLWKPGKKGICLKLEQYDKIVELMPKIQEAINSAKNKVEPT